jgi:hypothetical protein
MLQRSAKGVEKFIPVYRVVITEIRAGIRVEHRPIGAPVRATIVQTLQCAGLSGGNYFK